ncbi:hypothetical protein N184_33395 [Sinorhizobium sp. GL28]|nr:hypothetical protein N184_33395 [Sinorhizobium sp. GL28]
MIPADGLGEEFDILAQIRAGDPVDHFEPMPLRSEWR